MLFVAKSVALGHFVASWIARRAGTSIAAKKLLRRLHLLTPPKHEGLHVASGKERPDSNPGRNLNPDLTRTRTLTLPLTLTLTPTLTLILTLTPTPIPTPTLTRTRTLTITLARSGAPPAAAACGESQGAP